MNRWSEYRVIIMQENGPQITVLKQLPSSRYTYYIGTTHQILNDSNCLFNQVNLYNLINNVERRSNRIVPILKKFTRVANLDRCYFVWADQIKSNRF